MFFWWNPLYWLFMAPALLLMLYAQWRVSSAYNKWSRVPNTRSLTGAKVAQELLNSNGLYGVAIKPMAGRLTDNYDPRNKSLNLSQGSLQGNSVAAMAVVAHEIGHAKQDFTNYPLMALRSGLVPVVNVGSRLGFIVFLVGFFLSFTPLLWLGILMFASAFVFTLVTLPVELNASHRAMEMLTTSGIIVGNNDRDGARAVLNAAALTYVAAMLTSLLQLLYYVSMAMGGRRRS